MGDSAKFSKVHLVTKKKSMLYFQLHWYSCEDPFREYGVFFFAPLNCSVHTILQLWIADMEPRGRQFVSRSSSFDLAVASHILTRQMMFPRSWRLRLYLRYSAAGAAGNLVQRP